MTENTPIKKNTENTKDTGYVESTRMKRVNSWANKNYNNNNNDVDDIDVFINKKDITNIKKNIYHVKKKNDSDDTKTIIDFHNDSDTHADSFSIETKRKKLKHYKYSRPISDDGDSNDNNSNDPDKPITIKNQDSIGIKCSSDDMATTINMLHNIILEQDNRINKLEHTTALYTNTVTEYEPENYIKCSCCGVKCTLF